MMSEIALQESENENWKTRVLIVGGLLGTLVGLASAYLLIQSRQDEEAMHVSAGEGVKLGVLVLGLLRSIASLGEGK